MMKKNYILLLFIASFFVAKAKDSIIIDSQMTFQEAIAGTNAPKDIIADLILLDVQYYGYDNQIHQGQLVIHKSLKKDVLDAFELLKKEKFPVEKCIPIVKYAWDDNSSMEDNNTSAFNYRKVAGKKKLSNHSYGRAIDINPRNNPAVYSDGKISPKGARYSSQDKGTILKDSNITKFFLERGWTWGGNWNSLKDYQHFEKTD